MVEKEVLKETGKILNPLSDEVLAHEPMIREYAEMHGIPEHVPLVMTVMMQESAGRGTSLLFPADKVSSPSLQFWFRIHCVGDNRNGGYTSQNAIDSKSIPA